MSTSSRRLGITPTFAFAHVAIAPAGGRLSSFVMGDCNPHTGAAPWRLGFSKAGRLRFARSHVEGNLGSRQSAVEFAIIFRIETCIEHAPARAARPAMQELSPKAIR
jgi:hypothetical protein